ncbi:hypothetical protein L1887_38086 [Cichorium endivia]|nr:hypothetical protein L1887_38086 [Cichorium endivia]
MPVIDARAKLSDPPEMNFLLYPDDDDSVGPIKRSRRRSNLKVHPAARLRPPPPYSQIDADLRPPPFFLSSTLLTSTLLGSRYQHNSDDGVKNQMVLIMSPLGVTISEMVQAVVTVEQEKAGANGEARWFKR